MAKHFSASQRAKMRTEGNERRAGRKDERDKDVVFNQQVALHPGKKKGAKARHGRV